jgi:hypothetical protein
MLYVLWSLIKEWAFLAVNRFGRIHSCINKSIQNADWLSNFRNGMLIRNDHCGHIPEVLFSILWNWYSSQLLLNISGTNQKFAPVYIPHFRLLISPVLVFRFTRPESHVLRFSEFSRVVFGQMLHPQDECMTKEGRAVILVSRSPRPEDGNCNVRRNGGINL